MSELGMHIADVRTHLCNARWRNWIFVEVETESGLIGLGEATTEGRERAVCGAIEDMTRSLIGKDARDIAAHSRNLGRDPFWVGGYAAQTAIAGIEIALWDILGQHLGQPVWRLLGGRVNDRVRVYANGWYFAAATVDEWADRAGEVVELGFTALKFDPFGTAGPLIQADELERAVEITAAVRRTVGSRVDLMIEGHGRFDVLAARRVAKALERFDPYWFEEPLPPGNIEALAGFASSTSIPIATGERLHSAQEFRELLAIGGAAVVQPDVVHAGGITETRLIADLAGLWNVAVAPHNPNGPVATAATLAVDAVIPNLLIQEMLAPWDAPWRDAVVEGSPIVVDGYLAISDRPGLGVQLNHEALAEHPFEPIDLGFFSDHSVLDRIQLRDTE